MPTPVMTLTGIAEDAGEPTEADRMNAAQSDALINQTNTPLAGSATVSAGTIGSSAGSTAIVPVQLNSTNVGGVQFTVTYDSTKLSIQSLAAITDRAANTDFTFNNSTPGQLGVVAVRLTAGEAFPTSTLLFNINFTVATTASAGVSQINFGNTPVPIKASDPAAEAATVTTTPGAVTITGPTAATVGIGGRVLITSGRGVAGARISLTDSKGNVRTTVTGLSGYYRFEDVEAGTTYIITATGKRMSFSQPLQVLNVNEETEEINFIANPTNRYERVENN